MASPSFSVGPKEPLRNQLVWWVSLYILSIYGPFPVQGISQLPALLVWYVDSDFAKTFDISVMTRSSSSSSLVDDNSDDAFFVLPSDLPKSSLNQQKGMGAELHGRIPASHCWDHSEPQVLAVEWASVGITHYGSGMAKETLERHGAKKHDSSKYGMVSWRGWGREEERERERERERDGVRREGGREREGEMG